MTKLALIKHALPRIDPATPARDWALSDAGRQRCAWLRNELTALGMRRLCCSLEPKALETARLAAPAGVTAAPRRDLHENDRTGLGFVGADTLNRRVREFFDRPSEIVLGAESADTALARFENAVRAAIAEAASQDLATQHLAIVSHGTVITLLVCRHNHLTPFDFWASLALPSYVLLDAESFALDGGVHNHIGA